MLPLMLTVLSRDCSTPYYNQQSPLRTVSIRGNTPKALHCFRGRACDVIAAPEVYAIRAHGANKNGEGRFWGLRGCESERERDGTLNPKP